MNKVIIIGNLTRDPEPNTTESGINYCKFTLAIKRPRSKDNTDFIRCIAWNNGNYKLADYLNNQTKGNKLAIEGYIQTGSYDKNGQKVYTTDVVAEQIEFLTPKEKKNEENQNNKIEEKDDDLPF